MTVYDTATQSPAVRAVSLAAVHAGIRLMLADDHRMLREGLRRSMAEQGFDMVGEARDGAEAVIEAASGSNHCDVRSAWALAMTVVHGPVGMHPSQTEHPDVIRAKANADKALRSKLGV